MRFKTRNEPLDINCCFDNFPVSFHQPINIETQHDIDKNLQTTLFFKVDSILTADTLFPEHILDYHMLANSLIEYGKHHIDDVKDETLYVLDWTYHQNQLYYCVTNMVGDLSKIAIPVVFWVKAEDCKKV